MDKIIAKIDATFDTVVGSKIVAVINALLGYVAGALKDVLGEEEAGKIVESIYKFGD